MRAGPPQCSGFGGRGNARSSSPTTGNERGLLARGSPTHSLVQRENNPTPPPPRTWRVPADRQPRHQMPAKLRAVSAQPVHVPEAAGQEIPAWWRTCRALSRPLAQLQHTESLEFPRAELQMGAAEGSRCAHLRGSGRTLLAQAEKGPRLPLCSQKDSLETGTEKPHSAGGVGWCASCILCFRGNKSRH